MPLPRWPGDFAATGTYSATLVGHLAPVNTRCYWFARKCPKLTTLEGRSRFNSPPVGADCCAGTLPPSTIWPINLAIQGGRGSHPVKYFSRLETFSAWLYVLRSAWAISFSVEAGKSLARISPFVIVRSMMGSVRQCLNADEAA